MFKRWSFLLAGLVTVRAFCQSTSGTSVDLQLQGRNPDFSNFSSTRPMTVSAAAPSTCQLGQFYFNSAAPAGANLYACTAPNVWTLEGGGNPAPLTATQLADFAATAANGVLNVGSACSASTPCNVRFGNTAYSFKNSATITPSGSTSGLVLIYIDNSGNLAAGSNISLTCSGCLYVPGVNSFPSDSIPLFSWTVTAGAFDAAGGTDFRAFLSSKNLVSGPGVLISESAGTSTVSIDPLIVSTFVSTPPATSSATCSTGQFSFDANYYYLCIAANSWKRVALSSF